MPAPDNVSISLPDASRCTMAFSTCLAACLVSTLLQVPYNANSREVPVEVTFDDRTNLLTYIGGGDNAEHRSAGQRLRHAISMALSNTSDVYVRNSCLGCADQLDHAATLRMYQASTFCLVLAGDTQSSRRASEVILHGCLPVFLGPPFNRFVQGGGPPAAGLAVPFNLSIWRGGALEAAWQCCQELLIGKAYCLQRLLIRILTMGPSSCPACSAPFASVLDYGRFSLVIHVEDTSGWVSTPVHQQQAQEWVPEAGPPTHSIPNMSQLVPTLRSLSKERIREMQAALQRVRRAFLWKSVLNSEQPSAVDIALHQAVPTYPLNISPLV